MALDAAGAGVALALHTSLETMLGDWRRARAARDTTGRWPVLATGWEPFGTWRERMTAIDLFSRWFFLEGAKGKDASPEGVQRRAEELDIDRRLQEVAIDSETYWREHADEIVQFLVEETRKEAGIAPEVATVRIAVGESPTPLLTADRFLFAWELEKGVDERMPADGTHLTWFEPDGQAVAVVLLPDPHPWDAFSYISSLYDACSYGHDLVVALARRWHDRFGAEPVALWGTMVEWFVEEPPIDPLVAWDLAREQELIAGNTTANAGVSTRDHSRALRGRRDWFLHSRP